MYYVYMLRCGDGSIYTGITTDLHRRFQEHLLELCIRDSHWGPMLLITLLVAIVVSLINLFLLRSTMMEIFIDCAVLFLFFGITAYDMNKIREIGMASLGSDRKLYIYGAMQLYLDFINSFLRLLALFAKRK